MMTSTCAVGAVGAAAHTVAPAATPALSLRGVGLSLERKNAQPLSLVDDVNLDLAVGERLALVGESGSGKSVLARSLLGLDPDIRRSGDVRLGGQLLDTNSERAVRSVRGRRIAMVFQNPMGALDPLMTIGSQLVETIRARGAGRAEARKQAVALLDELGIADAGQRLKAYPHEFSGGMRQRVALAMALAAQPEILLADEPTTALDVRAQEQVLEMLDRISRDRELSVLLITHDLALIAGFADRVAVMYAGRVVHDDTVDAVFADPAHPYTRGLLGALPRVDRKPDRLAMIAGTIPSPANRPGGCVFSPRCPQRMPVCETRLPASLPSPQGGHVACHLFAPDAGEPTP
jgi:peptide/nickel transport system ATP-binding protein